jgi:hypothetical protein
VLHVCGCWHSAGRLHKENLLLYTLRLSDNRSPALEPRAHWRPATTDPRSSRRLTRRSRERASRCPLAISGCLTSLCQFACGLRSARYKRRAETHLQRCICTLAALSLEPRDHGMRLIRWTLLLLGAATALLVNPAVAWDDVQCGVGGPCDDMQVAYADIVQGDACRSLYATGMCSGLCTRSLKAMIGRHLWTKCADRCDWSPGIVAAANSWLALCVSRPAPDVNQPEITEITSRRGQKSPDNAAGAPRTPPAHADTSFDLHRQQDLQHHFSDSTQGRNVRNSLFRRLSLHTTVRLMLPFLAVIAAFSIARRHSAVRKAIRRLLLPLAAKRGRMTDGLLSANVSTRRDLINIQRGARRHLKGMRSGYID